MSSDNDNDCNDDGDNAVAKKIVDDVEDEKADGREWRNADNQGATPPRTLPQNNQPTEASARELPFSSTSIPRRMRQGRLANSETGDVDLLQLAAERSQGIYRDTDGKEEGKTKPKGVDGDTSTKQANPGAYQAAPGWSLRRSPGFRMENFGREGADGPVDVLTNQSCLPDTVLSAVRVDQDELELNIRAEICNAAAQAQVIDLEQEASHIVEKKMTQMRHRYGLVTLLVSLAILLGVVLAAVFIPRNPEATSSTPMHNTTLSNLRTIRDRGYLNCGLTKRDETVKYTASYFDYYAQFFRDACIAFAAAIFEGEPNVTFVEVTEKERWKAMEDGAVDVLLTGIPKATESLHWNLDHDIPVQFSRPFLFDGVGIGGLPEYVTNCASKRSRGLQNTGDCVNVKFCVVRGSMASGVADYRLHPSQIVSVNQVEDLYNKFASGCCNLIATDYAAERIEAAVRESTSYTGEYLMGDALFSRQPFAAATRKLSWSQAASGNLTAYNKLSDPTIWSKFVNWVIHALIAAEENNITQATANQFPQTNVFGEEFEDMFRQALAQVGNIGEVFSRLELIMPRTGMNRLNDGTTGMHYSRSFGSLVDYGYPPSDNGTLTSIMNRGKLRCGIAIRENISATGILPTTLEPANNDTIQQQQQQVLLDPAFIGESFSPANIDFAICRALASAVFQGRLSVGEESCSAGTNNYNAARPTFEVIVLQDEVEGYAKLDDGSLDVVFGYRKELQNDIWEETTGQAFTFSQAYFFGPTEGQVTSANHCAVTRQQDQQWSDFVQLTVSALFYAEENGIVQATANSMPAVNRFGPVFRRMYKDIVFAVGNYGEVYEKSFGAFYPRDGTPNQLNNLSTPQFASMPGLF